ncbi:alpha/beta fold hydrolase [Saccharothrix hoggarensis]|uniref:Alpha/beta fold hydrolase n=1 Tax=Saccharothrix hoggarensis TaxID=913853 RepID=A0ABW3R4X7_9PSEU
MADSAPSTLNEHGGEAPEDLRLEDDYAGPRNLPVDTVTSLDGTVIAYEKSGSGPPVVVIGGGLNDKAMFAPFAHMLSEHYTVYNVDRRGHGDSDYGDPEEYSIHREVEDLAAVIEVAGEPAAVFANCTGGMVAIQAAADGVPMRRLGMYEPPYDSPKATDEQLVELKRLVAAGLREEAVTLFGKDIVGFITDETLEKIKNHPAWQAFVSMAPSAVYDTIISQQHNAVPFDLLPKITVPTLIISGRKSTPSIQEACVTLADRIPDARLIRLPDEGHLYDQRKVAPLMADFFI